MEEVVRDFVKMSQHLWLKLKYFLNPYPIVAFETLVHFNSTDCAPDFLLNCLLLKNCKGNDISTPQTCNEFYLKFNLSKNIILDGEHSDPK